MRLELTGGEADVFLGKLQHVLSAHARRVSSPYGDPSICCGEDDVSQVMLEVTAFLKDGTSLRPFKRYNRPILCPDDLVRYARRRLKTVFRSRKKAIERRNELLDQRRTELASLPPPIAEHPIFSREIILEILKQSLRDPIVHKLVVLWFAAHLLPGTKDLDPCQNKSNADAIGEDIEDVIKARKRLKTLVNRILSPKGPRK